MCKYEISLIQMWRNCHLLISLKYSTFPQLPVNLPRAFRGIQPGYRICKILVYTKQIYSDVDEKLRRDGVPNQRLDVEQGRQHLDVEQGSVGEQLIQRRHLNVKQQPVDEPLLRSDGLRGADKKDDVH